MNKYKSMKTVVASLVLATGVFSVSSSALASKAFTDIGNSGSHSTAIKHLNSLDVYDYKTGNQLKGSSAVTRAEASKILYNLNKDKMKKVRTYKNNFKDIAGNPFAKEMIWSYEVGIFDGASTSTFNPKQNMTRAQMAKILVNTFGLKSKGTTNFKDVSTKSWAHQYVSIMGSNGVTLGDGKGNYLPNDKVTLNHLSSFIYRIVAKDVAVKPEPSKPTTSKPVTPAPNKPTIKVEDYNAVKAAIKKLYVDPKYGYKEATVYTSNNLDDVLLDYLMTNDISQDVPGYTFHNRSLNYTVTEVSKGVFKNVMKVDHDRSLEEHNAFLKRTDAAEKYIVNNYKLDTDYDVVYAINDFVINQIEYGEAIPEDHKYLAWGEDNTTCTGYTDVMAVLLERFNIESRLVTGDVHAWNAVKVGGLWYYTDATFTDNTVKDYEFILFTQSKRLESLNNPIETTFTATDTPFTQSMAKPYTYKKK